ncbi:hypothetical protein [Nocardioides sp.]|uniref:hypothetical protein n=1 Tax=Nocardioides sp. TaxID=35761 RepID=UPI0027218425|nr:hypothetical protein [Nocardioides sp.]MDO9457565.1 hypothetical protein [Nocardioides sp.]
MSRKVYLHVGAPKTGTTYLQDRLTLNSAGLAEQGVHFPSRHALADPQLSQFRAALDLLGQDWGGPPGHAKGSWDALVRRVRRLDGTVVVSHETLGPAKPEAVRRALHDLRGSEVHLVYSARDLGRQLPAAWQESVKQGRTWTYRRFQRRMVRGLPWFARAFDLPSVLGTWGADLPPERIHVVTVPHETGDLLWERFCDVLGIAPVWAPRDAERVNRSLGVAETQLLRRLNTRIDHATRRGADFDELVRHMLADRMLANRRGTRLQLPPHLHPWAVSEADRWSEWITTRGVQVVGDLADLQPGPAVVPEEFVDPAAVSAKAQLGAALDALTAMTVEAARRPDPDARFTAKVRGGLRARKERR